MNDLLTFAVDAHGGLARWNTFTKLCAEVSIGGAIWDFKQQPGSARRQGVRDQHAPGAFDDQSI